jgi:ubiquinone/menaquinone biosynthesis C-methylase UbiE
VSAGRSPVVTELPGDLASEEARIRAAYARRPKQDPRYSFANPTHVFQRQERERSALELLRRHGGMPLLGKSVLEVGWGTGGWLLDFVKWGAEPEDVTGVDLLPDRVALARRRCPQGVTVGCVSGAALPFPGETFDIVLQATMFSSILDPGTRRQVAAEMLRVVRREGFILWYDFHVNNPWNRDVRRVTKAEIGNLFPACRIELRRVTLAAPLARRLVPWSWLASYLLTRIPLLCTHYLGVVRKA